MKKVISLITVLVMSFVFSIGILAVDIPSETIANTEAPTIIPSIPDDDDDISPLISVLFVSVNIEPGYYYIQNVLTGMYIDIHGPNTDMIHQWTYHNGFQEVWNIQKVIGDESYYTIQSLYSGKYLGIENSNVGEDNINQYSTQSEYTKWSIRYDNKKYVFEPKMAWEKALKAPNKDIGSELQLDGSKNNSNYACWKLYKLENSYSGNRYIQNIGTGRVAGVYGPYMDEGTKVHQWDFYENNNFKWTFEYNSGDLSYSIKNVYTGKYLGYSSETDSSGNYYIAQYTSNTDSNTRWKVYKQSTGNLILAPRDIDPTSLSLSVDPPYNDYGSYLKLVPYTADENYKDEWQVIGDFAYAGDMGEAWNSDVDYVVYWNKTSIIVYKENLYNVDDFLFDENIDHALEQWGEALGLNFSFTTNKNLADIIIYGGTESQMETMANSTNTNWRGLTFYNMAYDSASVVTLENSNILKCVYQFNQATVYIKYFEDKNVKKTCIHELGHALGYAGHSKNSKELMYTTTDNVDTFFLSTAEKQHLNAVYDKFVN